MDQAALQGDSGITREQRWIVETLEPALNGLSAATVVDRHCDGRKDACDAARVAARVSVLESSLGIPVRLVPIGRPCVEHTDEAGLARREVAAKHITEQPVIPVPDAMAVERNQEEVRALDTFELTHGAFCSEHRITEAPAHLLEH